MARKGRSVKSARALKYLFASGILTSRGSGSKRTVTYNKARAQSIRKAAGKGAPSSTYAKKSGGALKSSVAGSPGQRRGLGKRKNGPDKFQRTAIQGKAAHLRSGSGSGGRKVPSKAERDKTRAERIAKGRKQAVGFVAREHAKAKAPIPMDSKVMQSRFAGKYQDTGESFKAGERIHYVRGAGAFKNKPVRRRSFHEIDQDKSNPVAQAGARMVDGSKQRGVHRRIDARNAGQSTRRSGSTTDEAFSDLRSGFKRNGFKEKVRQGVELRKEYREYRANIAGQIREARRKGDKASIAKWRQERDPEVLRLTSPRRSKGYRNLFKTFLNESSALYR